MAINKPINLIDHKQAWDLLPWLVNETLSSEEHLMVDSHIKTCTLCQRELKAQRHFSALIMKADVRAAEEPGGFDALMKRIDSIDKAGSLTGQRDESTSWETVWLWIRSQLVMPRFSIASAAALAVIAAVLSFGWLQGVRPGEQAEYRTLTSVPSEMTGGGPLLNVTLAEGVGVPEASAIFGELGGRIIDGPTADGIYTVEWMPDLAAGSADERLGLLRQDARVLFVEQVAIRGADQ